MEREGLIKRIPASKKRVKDTFALAIRDLKIARKIVDEDYDWTFSIAYNSMLQAARALVFSKGYRPSGDTQHISVVKFAEVVLREPFRDHIILFDRMRRKRHTVVYDTVGTISKSEAKTQ